MHELCVQLLISTLIFSLKELKYFSMLTIEMLESLQELLRVLRALKVKLALFYQQSITAPPWCIGNPQCKYGLARWYLRKIVSGYNLYTTDLFEVFHYFSLNF